MTEVVYNGSVTITIETRLLLASLISSCYNKCITRGKSYLGVQMFKTTVLVLAAVLVVVKVATTEEGTLRERLAYLGRGLIGGHSKHKPKH